MEQSKNTAEGDSKRVPDQQAADKNKGPSERKSKHPVWLSKPVSEDQIVAWLLEGHTSEDD